MRAVAEQGVTEQGVTQMGYRYCCYCPSLLSFFSVRYCPLLSLSVTARLSLSYNVLLHACPPLLTCGTAARHSSSFLFHGVFPTSWLYWVFFTLLTGMNEKENSPDNGRNPGSLAGMVDKSGILAGIEEKPEYPTRN